MVSVFTFFFYRLFVRGSVFTIWFTRWLFIRGTVLQLDFNRWLFSRRLTVLLNSSVVILLFIWQLFIRGLTLQFDSSGVLLYCFDCFIYHVVTHQGLCNTVWFSGGYSFELIHDGLNNNNTYFIYDTRQINELNKHFLTFQWLYTLLLIYWVVIHQVKFLYFMSFYHPPPPPPTPLVH